MTNSAARHIHVAIVGAGFAGIGAAIRLAQDGIDDYLVFERAHDVGGVWRDNSYPGCACDVQSHLYCFSFAPNPNWSHSYSPQQEIWDYLRRCTEQFGIRPKMRFDHAIREAAWDAHEQRWRIETSHGPYTADVLVGAVGALSEPSVPELPGLDRFTGKVFHSARWDHDYPLAGKRVAVIGTGASAIQFVPQIQPTVGKLTLFQRTPPWIVPRQDFAYSDERKQLLRRSRLARAWTRGAIYASREWMAAAFLHPRLAALGEKMALRHLERQVPDPVLREKLTPTYRMGCKRVLVSDDYLPSLSQPNVEVVTAGIAEVRPGGVVTSDGVEHAVDAIILGTGFAVTEMPFARHVRGRDGRTLAQVWNGSMRAHLGTTITGFPNFFLIPGPNTGLGHTSMILMIEAQLEHLIGALRHLRRRNLAAVEPTEAAQSAFVAEVDRKMGTTVWTTGGCKSWYLDKTGRNSTLWPGYTFSFRRRVKRFRPEEYVAEAHRHAPAKTDWRGRMQLALARGLSSLPPSLQQRLAGGKVVVDGLTLAPDVQLLLAARRAQGAPSMTHGSPRVARRRLRREAAQIAGNPTPVGAVRNFDIDGAAGPLRARHYAPDTALGAPLLLFFHGGGFVLGDLDTHDELCRLLCRHAGLHVLSVDYRLAPEHPFPAAVDDAIAAYDWACAHASKLGAHPSRVAVGGDSAGGNLSAVIAQEAKRTGRPAPALQLLLYPAVDRSKSYPSVELFAEGFFLESADMRWFVEHYIGDQKWLLEPRADPGLADDLSGLPPALLVTAGFDPLRDEGETYAARLQEAGSPVTLRRFDSLIHGFANLASVSRSCREALMAVAAETRALLDALHVTHQSARVGGAQLAGAPVHVEGALGVDGEPRLAR